MADQKKGPTEEFRVKGEALLKKVREIVHEGNVRRLIIKDTDGKTLIEVPVTVGVVGVLVAPVAAAIGAIAALATNYSIQVEREDSKKRQSSTRAGSKKE
jgi:Domain of unknown function (DUF4342)